MTEGLEPLDRLTDVDDVALAQEAPELASTHRALLALAAEPVPDPVAAWSTIESRLRRPGGLVRLRARSAALITAAALTISGTAVAYAAAPPVRHGIDRVIDWVTGQPSQTSPSIRPDAELTPAERSTMKESPTTDSDQSRDSDEETESSIEPSDRDGESTRDESGQEEQTSDEPEPSDGIEPSVDEGPSVGADQESNSATIDTDRDVSGDADATEVGLID